MNDLDMDEFGRDDFSDDDDFDDDFEETPFIDTPGTSAAGVHTWEAPPETPAWAGGTEIPAGISKKFLAPRKETESLVKRWKSKVSKHGIKATLEFRSTKKGDLWVKWGKNWKLLTFKNDPNRFLGASSVKKYGVDLARALGVIGDRSQVSQKMVKTLQSTGETLAKTAASIETSELSDVPRIVTDAINTVETTVNEINGTKYDPPLPLRELLGLDKALQTTRGELVNNLSKLTALDKHIALEERKLGKASGDRESTERINNLLRSLRDEREARLEAASTNRETLSGQLSRSHETISRVLHEETTLGERLRTLFREKGFKIVTILTAFTMIISTLILSISSLVLSITGGAAPAPAPAPALAPAPAPAPSGGAKEWIKTQLKALANLLAKLAGKVAAALPGLIGGIVSFLLSILAKTARWLAENAWALIVAIAGLLLLASREFLNPKRK